MHGSAPRLCRKPPSFARRVALISLVAGVMTACERGSPATPSPSSSGSLVNLSANLSFCADEVNRYRVSVGRPPLSRSAELEAFAAKAAEDDGRSHQPHHWFAITNGGGMARAENEILWWQGFGVRSVIEQGLQQMWQGGPSGEHYDIMVGQFSQIGCGIFVNGAEVTVAQDFR
jgi:uncharacterized protein YkwD